MPRPPPTPPYMRFRIRRFRSDTGRSETASSRRFRSLSRRRVRLSTVRPALGILSLLSATGPSLLGLCINDAIEYDCPTCTRSCSALRRYRLLRPLLTSRSGILPSAFQPQGEISPGMTHLPSRLCLSDLRHVVRASTGLWPFRLPHPNVSPRIRFLFVRPAFCFQLPPDAESPEAPLPSANSSPCWVSRGLSPPSRCALPGAPKKSRGTRPRLE